MKKEDYDTFTIAGVIEKKEETEIERYAIFRDGVLVEEGEREVPIRYYKREYR